MKGLLLLLTNFLRPLFFVRSFEWGGLVSSWLASTSIEGFIVLSLPKEYPQALKTESA